MGVLEIDARNILTNYTGSNNQIIELKLKLLNSQKFSLTRTQADYILKYHNVEPKVAKKHINLVKSFGERLMEEKLLVKPVEQIWCEKLLCESDKAYHIYGKIIESDKLNCFWLPKAAVLRPEKKFKGVIDYTKYSKRPPMEHQKVAIETLLANDKYILADDMGLGKTTSATIASLESGAKKVLIICPASLKINWKRELENYTDKRILIVEGTKWGSTYDYYIINYDILKNYHSIEEGQREMSLLLNEKFDLVIVDEAHNISNTTAQRTKLVNDLLSEIPKIWLLTGTPMTSRPINYFNLLELVESSVAMNWQHYVKRYCGGYQFSVDNGFGKKRKVWNTNGATHLDELRERTKDIVLRRLKTEVLDLPDKIVTPIYINLENLIFYDNEFENFIKISEEEKSKDSLSVSLNRLMKLRQIISFEKIEYTCELIDNFIEQGKKVIVFTNFTNTLDTIHERYKKNSVVLDGRMSKEKRQISIDRFQNDDKIKVFIGNIVAAGVGITLTAAEGVIMNDLSFVPAHHAQAEDRAMRIGQKNSVLVYYPVFENTIEMNIYNILSRKKNIIDTVMGDIEQEDSFTKELLSSILKKPLD